MSDVAGTRSSYVITSTTNHPMQRKTTSFDVCHKSINNFTTIICNTSFLVK